jgi:hypothetical protein
MAQMTRRALIAATLGLTLGGAAVFSGACTLAAETLARPPARRRVGFLGVASFESAPLFF